MAAQRQGFEEMYFYEQQIVEDDHAQEEAVSRYYDTFLSENEKEEVLFNKKQTEKLKNRLKPRLFEKVSKFELALVLSIVIGFLTFCIIAVFVSTKISSTINTTVNIQTENNQLSEKNKELQQQINELSSAERVKKIAEKNGLSTNNDNFKRIK